MVLQHVAHLRMDYSGEDGLRQRRQDENHSHRNSEPASSGSTRILDPGCLGSNGTIMTNCVDENKNIAETVTVSESILQQQQRGRE